MLTTLRMVKDVGPNLEGELASFPPDHASTLVAKGLGLELATFDERTHRFDPETEQVVELPPAVPVNVDGEPLDPA